MCAAGSTVYSEVYSQGGSTVVYSIQSITGDWGVIGCRLHTAGLQWVYSDSTVSTGFLPRARRVYSGQGTSAYCRRPGKRKTTHTCTHADMCMCTCMWGGAVCCAVVSLEALYGRYHTTKSGSAGHLNTTKWVRGARRKCSVTDISKCQCQERRT